MTWSIRLKLWGGILVVAALVFALTLLFNQRQSQVASVTASIDAPAATVGSSYGGVVTDLYVRQGEAVTAGDALFTLNSIQLQQDVGNGLKPVSTEAYTLDPASGTVTYKAVSNGYVASIDAERHLRRAGAVIEPLGQFGENLPRRLPRPRLSRCVSIAGQVIPRLAGLGLGTRLRRDGDYRPMRPAHRAFAERQRQPVHVQHARRGHDAIVATIPVRTRLQLVAHFASPLVLEN